MNLYTGFVFDALPGMWREVFKWPVAERIRRFREPALRKQLAADAATVPAEAALVAGTRGDEGEGRHGPATVMRFGARVQRRRDAHGSSLAAAVLALWTN